MGFFECKRYNGYVLYATSFHGYGLEEWNISNIDDMMFTFNGASQFNINVSKWDTSSIASLDGTFYFAEKFEGIGIDEWMQYPNPNMDSTVEMFRNTSVFNTNLSKWNTSYIRTFGTFRFMNSSLVINHFSYQSTQRFCFFLLLFFTFIFYSYNKT